MLGRRRTIWQTERINRRNLGTKRMREERREKGERERCPGPANQEASRQDKTQKKEGTQDIEKEKIKSSEAKGRQRKTG